jgi:serine protease Do
MKKGALLAATFLLLALACKANYSPPLSSSAGKPASSNSMVAGGREGENDFTSLAQNAMPAVAHIYSLKERPKPSLIPMLFLGKSFLKSVGIWIRSNFTSNYDTMATGSGFIISKRGYILTNAHVLNGADRIVVKIPGFPEAGQDAEKLGVDASSDVAIIKVKGDYRYTCLKMGDSDNVEVGEWVVAIGHPFDMGETLTVGVVSGLRRDDIGMLELEDFIQTDASINPGNSGGPLLNVRGEVIGLNSIIFSEASHIGLAVPINIAKNIMFQLINGERIDRGMIGVSLGELTPALASSLGVTQGVGALVTTVRDNTPAHSAGVRPGDVVTGFNGKKITSYRELKKAAISMLAGSHADLQIIRGGQEIHIGLTLAKMNRRT